MQERMTGKGNVKLYSQHKPSIYEIFAAETLDDSLYLSISQIIEVLEFYRPITFRGRKIISGLLTWILQSYFVTRHDASFGELFYGLQRITKPDSIQQKSISKILNTIAVLVPIVKLKLIGRLPLDMPVLQGVAKVFGLITSVQAITYMIRFSNSHSPLLSGMNMRLGYRKNQEAPLQMSILILKTLEILAFLLNFVSFRQMSRKTNSSKKFTSLTHLNLLAESKSQMNLCGICQKKPDNLTISSVSGYGFCFNCIYIYLKKHKKCPITELKCDMNDLVRIYV